MSGDPGGRYDVVTLGETMLRLSPPVNRRLEQTLHFEVEIGGSESNTAVGLSRMGLRAAWLSRMTDNAPGRIVTRLIGAQGVDVSHVAWTREDRVGVFYFEEARPPRPSRVVYDRAGSACSRMTPADLPAALFGPGAARLLHLTGITLALSATAADTCLAALARARAAGWWISVDLNYRSLLWTPAQAAAGLAPALAEADLVFAPWGDVQALYPGAASPELGLRAMRARAPRATLVMTAGAAGSLALAAGSEEIVTQPAFEATEVTRLGGGDAFSAGFLYGWLTDSDGPARLARALRFGAALAALKYTIPGDLPLVDAADVHALAESGRTARLMR